MIEKIISGIHGVGNYGTISICLFFACFIGTVVWALTRKKHYLTRMSSLPLNDGSKSGDSTNNPQP